MKYLSAIAIASLIILGCGSSKKTNKSSAVVVNKDLAPAAVPVVNLDTIVKIAYQNYQPSAPIISQLMHTSLEVNFDWKKCYMYGKATITLRPHFYPADSLTLDAKGMDIKEVSILKGKAKQALKYTYDSLQLHIALDKTYTSHDSFMIYVDYVSMPNKLANEQGGSAAITSHKGLFFINPDGKDSTKPRQLWTQGETEDNSCWFPTIDKPDQRMTEDIFITAEKDQKTLSNGAMVSSKENADGSHTDHWVMSPNIPPYLVMMAVGPFAIVHDSWRGRPVDFYVDPKYAPYAMDIFGNTPQMIEFFSNVLKFPYAWNKYDQVVAHDYVSGAMENTTATLHGTFVQVNRRELIDERLEGVDNGGVEDIVSHELFHHWFGDLVTCESWSNIPLNESFATYGEYLWREHKYGRDEADRHLQMDATIYLNNVREQHDLVDFYYHDKEDLFDLISYQKGGTILHMLRSVVGDSAFFESLHIYLEEHKFQPVEAHMLRLAFEKVTGKDLNWFFNEWFYNKGFSQLNIAHSYDDNSHTVTLKVDQVQDIHENPVFKMPVKVDIYANGSKESHVVEMSKSKDVFKFHVASKPDWVDFDAQKMLLSVKDEDMNLSEREFQYAHGPLYMDRYDALNRLSEHLDDAGAKATVMSGLHDKYWSLRRFAIEKMGADSTPAFKAELLKLANDSCSLVRSAAIAVLSKNYTDKGLLAVYRKAINDSSYSVETGALNAIAKLDKDEAMKDAKQMESEDEASITMGIGEVYARYGSDANNDFFVRAKSKVSGYEQIAYVVIYGQFLKNCGDETVNKGMAILQDISKNGDNNFVKFYAKNVISQISSMYSDREGALQSKMDDLKKKNPNDAQIATIQSQIDACKKEEKKISEITK
jgi:aminopeptidase N